MYYVLSCRWKYLVHHWFMQAQSMLRTEKVPQYVCEAYYDKSLQITRSVGRTRKTEL